MGSEMEPLLLAWSYFRRRKFQLCADLCTQMLEKSPYDQVPARPRQPCGFQREAEGTGGSPGCWVGAPGRKARAKLTVWSAQASGTRPPRAVAGVPAGPSSAVPWPPPPQTSAAPFLYGSLKGLLKKSRILLWRRTLRIHLYLHRDGL